MPAPIRVTLIGYGYSGKTFHAPLMDAVEGIDLVRIASSDAARVHADWPGMAVAADPHAAITADDIDLVVIATPNDTHAPLSRKALVAGKHVIVDKPFTLDLAEARNVIAQAGETHRLLSVFHNRRWDSDFLAVRRAIEGGSIGTVRHMESHFDRFRPQVRDRWRERAGPGSGIWFDLGPHLVDQALCLFGLPDRVTGDLAIQRPGAGADDWAHVVLHYGERRVVLHAGMLVAGGTHRFIAHGDTGSIVKPKADRQEAQLIAGMRIGETGWGEDPDPLIRYDAAGGEHPIAAPAGDQRLFYAGVVAALRDGAPNPVRPIEALATMAVVEAAIRSAERGEARPLDLSDDERASFLAFPFR